MIRNTQQAPGALDRRAERRSERREFFRIALGAAAVTGAGLAAFGVAGRAAAATVTDTDILNFALNLEYLEASFYLHAAYGYALDESLLGGSGTRGKVIGGRQADFADDTVRAFAREIAFDEVGHVKFLRKALGSSAVAQPTLDISPDPAGAFSTAARAAGLIGAGESFDPYANDDNFLLAAFLVEDLGVTAYKGITPLLSDATYLEAAAGILAVEAYHASMIRATLAARGIDTPSLIASADAISDARDSLDGASDRDQGLSPVSTSGSAASNITPLDDDGIAYSRTPQQVLNIVYLTAAAAPKGGFFPDGTNNPNAALTVSGDTSAS